MSALVDPAQIAARRHPRGGRRRVPGVHPIVFPTDVWNEPGRMMKCVSKGHTRLRNQLKHAVAISGDDPYRPDSGHTGIKPYTRFQGDPYENLEPCWGTAAYGSPRYTRIHAAGNDPGDVSIQLFDASIAFDGNPCGTMAASVILPVTKCMPC